MASQPARLEVQPARSESKTANQPGLRLQAWLDGPEGGMDGRTDGQTENLPILLDVVPYRNRCPANPMRAEKSREGQGNR